MNKLIIILNARNYGKVLKDAKFKNKNKTPKPLHTGSKMYMVG